MDLGVVYGRHSVRTFTELPIEAGLVNRLNEHIEAYNFASGLHIKLVTNEPSAFGTSLMAKYGKFRNANNYFCMIGPKGMDEEIGYYGEKLVLDAQMMGLNTCWVGLSFKKRKIKSELEEGLKIYALIAVGYGTTQGSTHKIKQPLQICPNICESPEWVQRGVNCTLLAPSAMNQQQFRFKWLGEKRVHAYTGIGVYTKIDLGIAKLHFEIGATPVAVEWV
jgi:hypothetical protein